MTNTDNTNAEALSTSPQSIANKDYTPNEILKLGYDDDYLEKVDEEYLNELNALAPKVNAAVRGYNGQQGNSLAPKRQTFKSEAAKSNVLSWDLNVNKTMPGGPRQTYIKPREYFGIRQTNFDRYYNHPKFAELGFHPYRDNEAVYNENSTWSDDWSRMTGQFMTNMLPAFSPFGIFDFGTDPDTDSAAKMSDAMRIGNSSKEGFGASFTNFSLNSAYTVGIIGSIAVEEAAMWGGTALLAAATPFTGGASGVAAVGAGTAAVARTGWNMAKLAKGFERMMQGTMAGRAFSASRNLVGALK